MAKNKKNKETLNEENNKIEFCDFKQFMKTLKEVSSESSSLKELCDALEIGNDDFASRIENAKSFLKECRRNVVAAFSKLNHHDTSLLYDKLKELNNRELSYNINFIANEHQKMLKKKLSNSNITTTTNKDENHKSKKEKQENIPTVKMSSDFVKGLSVIDYIDYNFETNIIERFTQEMKNIDTDNLSEYIEKTNRLIDRVLFETYFKDKESVVRGVKNHFGLEFSIIKRDDEILNEIISDELRFYQQKRIVDKLDNMDTTYLGTSKRISKDINPNSDNITVTFEELYTSSIPHYAFLQKEFDNKFIIRSASQEVIKEDYVAKHLAGASFLAFPANVLIAKDENDDFVAYSNQINRFKF